MRKIDRLGRIVIPQVLRRKYGLKEGTKVEFLDAGEGITVRPSEAFCRLCRSKICAEARLPLCEECMAKVVADFTEIQ